MLRAIIIAGVNNTTPKMTTGIDSTLNMILSPTKLTVKLTVKDFPFSSHIFIIKNFLYIQTRSDAHFLFKKQILKI
jgi:hypothetical protein